MVLTYLVWQDCLSKDCFLTFWLLNLHSWEAVTDQLLLSIPMGDSKFGKLRFLIMFLIRGWQTMAYCLFL